VTESVWTTLVVRVGVKGTLGQRRCQQLNIMRVFQCWTDQRFLRSYYVIKSDPNPVILSKYLIRSSSYPKITLIKDLNAVINLVWSGRVFFKTQSNLVLNCRTQFVRHPETGSCSKLTCWYTTFYTRGLKLLRGPLEDLKGNPRAALWRWRNNGGTWT